MSDGLGGETSGLAGLGEMLAGASNPDLLGALDAVLLELERRLLGYVRGASVLGVADEGLLLSVRASARLAQARSSTAHAQSHLQIVGVGTWRPGSTDLGWQGDPRIAEAD